MVFRSAIVSRADASSMNGTERSTVVLRIFDPGVYRDLAGRLRMARTSSLPRTHPGGRSISRDAVMLRDLIEH